LRAAKFKPFALSAQNLFELILLSITQGFLFRFLLPNHDLVKEGGLRL
jgi:hypothetical protein